MLCAKLVVVWRLEPRRIRDDEADDFGLIHTWIDRHVCVSLCDEGS